MMKRYWYLYTASDRGSRGLHKTSQYITDFKWRELLKSASDSGTKYSYIKVKISL